MSITFVLTTAPAPESAWLSLSSNRESRIMGVSFVITEGCFGLTQLNRRKYSSRRAAACRGDDHGQPRARTPWLTRS